MRKLVISTLLLLFFGQYIFGQHKTAITYSIGFPIAETSDYFGSTSWLGINLDYHYFVKEKLAIGFSTGGQVFNDNRGYITETIGTETVSGFRYNYLNSLPVLVTGSYFFSPSETFSPYVSLGMGLVYNQLNEDVGLYTKKSTGWPLSIRPEIGMDFEINYNVGVRAAFKYNYVASGNDLPSFSYFALNLGFVFGN
ncbi:outer membrane beta-barrel protein [Muriicola sp.]|uniref:outer membrane beta-barrel protein n=1 Tax=Muriicola sp. TaxID=2020856 RepID=UPI003C737011